MKAGILRWLLLLAFIGTMGAGSSRGQTPDAPKTPDLQQLKEKLQQLEQELQELKGQISAAEQAQKAQAAQPPAAEQAQKPPAAAVPPTEQAQKAPVPPPPPAAQQPQTPPLTPVAIMEEEHNPENAPPADTIGPNGAPIAKPATKNTLNFYGFTMMDTGYEFGQSDPDWYDVVRPTKLDAYPNEFAPSGKVFFSVRQSRFGVKSTTATPFGDLNTIFEFELFGTGVDAGQTTFRLRHAYGELGQFGAGQTNSTFMDIDVFPNSIEYWGPNGMVFFRNLQFRWMPVRGRSRVTLALERPGASADQGVYQDRIELQGVKPQFQWPDLTGHGRLGRDWGYVQLAGIVRSIKWVDTNASDTDKGINLSGSAVGWGLNFSSNLNLSKKDVGKFQLVYGKGIENYMNDAPEDIGIKNNFSNPHQPVLGVPLPVLGIVAFVDHTWSPKFSSSAGYSMENITNSDGQLPSAFHQGHYALGNLLFYPVKDVTVGGEFQFGRRVNNSDGFNVNDYRIQFSFKYNFGKVFGF